MDPTIRRGFAFLVVSVDGSWPRPMSKGVRDPDAFNALIIVLEPVGSRLGFVHG
jgi:hypothetical protein